MNSNFSMNSIRIKNRKISENMAESTFHENPILIYIYIYIGLYWVSSLEFFLKNSKWEYMMAWCDRTSSSTQTSLKPETLNSKHIPPHKQMRSAQFKPIIIKASLIHISGMHTRIFWDYFRKKIST